MRFLSRKNPIVYLSETREYITDLQRVTALRNICQNPAEKADFDNLIHIMQEVLMFMNTITIKDKSYLNKSL